MAGRKPIYSRGVPSAVIFTVFLAFASVYIPILGLFTTFIWAVPTAVLTARTGLGQGMLAAILSFAWLAFTVSPAWASMAALQFAGIGLVLGFLLRKSNSSSRVIIITVVVSLLITGAIFSFPLLMGNTPGGFAAELQSNTGSIYDLWESMGLLDPLQEQGVSKEEIKESLQSAVDWIIRLLPAIMVTTAAATAFISFLAARTVLVKTGSGIADFPPFRRWYVPWHLSWAAILGLGLTLLGDYVGNKMLLALGENTVFLCIPVAFIIGLSMFIYFLGKVHSGFFKACIVFASFFYLPLTALFLLVVGVFDPLFDFRKIHFKSV